MSNYVHRKGFIYPIESGSPDIDEKATILLNKDKFVLANIGKNRYLVWLVYSSCGVQRRTFGHCRQCTSKEIESFAPLFRNVLGDIDKTKLKYIDYCYCNSRDCIIDYYKDEQMTLDSAIAIAREGAKNKYDAAGKDCQQFAGWLQELAGFKDSTPITDGWLETHNFKGGKLPYFIYDKEAYVHMERSKGKWLARNGLGKNKNSALIETRGQFRMFLAICGMAEEFIHKFDA